MVKAKVKCPVCKDPIDAHDENKALECFNEAGIAPAEIEMSGVVGAGYAYAGLKGVGQKHADKNIMSMNFKGKVETSVTPNLLILQKCLLAKVKKEKKDEGSKGTASESSKDSGDSEGSPSE